MKNSFFFFLIVFSVSMVFCQSTSNNNTWTATPIKYIGFDGSNGVNPLYFRTNAITRMRLNGTQTNHYNGFNHDVSGHFGIGLSNYFATNTPLTMLHLEGLNNTTFQFGQFRSWMRTGVFIRENSDGMYVGLKPEGFNRSDAVISWSDDAAGVDKLRFLFTTTQLTLPGPINPLHGESRNGYEFMRMQSYLPINNSANFPVGHIGIGPLFTDVFAPHSRLHLHAEDRLSNFTQFTNQASTNAGNLASAGFRIGIHGNDSLNRNGIALVYNQENRPLLLSANANTTNVNGFITNERLRIMAYNTPTVLPTIPATYGFYNPAPDSIPNNVTRMSISHNPASPVTRPMSLLHLGYNTGSFLNPNSTDGWRSWMDVGIFMAQGTDNVFLGLKKEPSMNPIQPDRFDAVLNWGDNQAPDLINGAGPDNLRFIFTSTTTATFGVGDSISQSHHGLETGRFYPGYDSTFTYLLTSPKELYGRFGIGDFTASGVNQNPTHKLDVIGNGRFRYLPDSLYLADTSKKMVKQ